MKENDEHFKFTNEIYFQVSVNAQVSLLCCGYMRQSGYFSS